MIGGGLGAWSAFACLTTLTIGGALLTITRNNLVSAVMSLVLSFLGVAGLYAMLSAHFLAAIQVLVYAGGIMVLFVFVVMVLNRDEKESWFQRGALGKTMIMAGIGYLSVRLGIQLVRYATSSTHAACWSSSATGTLEQTGWGLFTEYLFPFEALSIVLLIAMIAAVVIARDHASQPTSPYDVNREMPSASHESFSTFHEESPS